jgi:tRNA-dihydrouridine synthase C
MEGVTEPPFRNLLFALHPASVLGGAFTEFVRVTDHPVPRRVLSRHGAGPREGAPVGVQLMGSAEGPLAATAAAAEALGAPLVDLNFGCPAKGALRGCAGSALLDHPERIEGLVRACVAATSVVPVTAKVRAGGEDASRVEEIARAVEAGGAAMLTLHARTRREFYAPEVDWSRIARAVAAVRIPVCGNGGIRVHGDFARMRQETGCAFAMAGQGAIADPWIFSGRKVTRAEAARFLIAYTQALGGGTGPRVLRAGAARVKQLLRTWTAGGLVDGDRARWLRERDPEVFFGWLREAAGQEARPQVPRSFVSGP